MAKENVARDWIFLFIVLGFLWVGLPWMAPVFIKMGWGEIANVIYRFYSYQCHQMPQRSFFLFGPQTMYSLDQIHAAGVDVDKLLELRRFIGNPDLGYKVAWSDRMVSAYGSLPLMALLWWPLRRKIKPLPIIGFILLVLPMALDAGTHFLSDLAGIGQGFRYTNAWLADLTAHQLPTSFYVGNALGSFNSWIRLITGVLFGVSVIWLGLPLFWRSARQPQGSHSLQSQQVIESDHA
jgi:uncharacterized membrane protein